MDHAATHSTSTPTRPSEHPNACDRCGSFRRVGERYEPPTAHFAHCRDFIDQGVLRMAGTAPRQRGQHR
jgi:hypothetical protein